MAIFLISELDRDFTPKSPDSTFREIWIKRLVNDYSNDYNDVAMITEYSVVTRKRTYFVIPK